MYPISERGQLEQVQQQISTAKKIICVHYNHSKAKYVLANFLCYWLPPIKTVIHITYYFSCITVFHNRFHKTYGKGPLYTIGE